MHLHLRFGHKLGERLFGIETCRPCRQLCTCANFDPRRTVGAPRLRENGDGCGGDDTLRVADDVRRLRRARMLARTSTVSLTFCAFSLDTLDEVTKYRTWLRMEEKNDDIVREWASLACRFLCRGRSGVACTRGEALGGWSMVGGQRIERSTTPARLPGGDRRFARHKKPTAFEST